MGYFFSDPSDDKAFFAELKNAIPFGRGEGQQLRTTDSESGTYQIGVTTYSASDILQGVAANKPPGLTYNQYNQTLTSDLNQMVQEGGGQEKVLGARAALAPYDYLSKIGFNDHRIQASSIDSNNTAAEGMAGQASGPAPAPIGNYANFTDMSGVIDYGTFTTSKGTTLVMKSYKGTKVDVNYMGSWKAMADAAAAAGIDISGGGFRTPEEQIKLRRAHCGTSHYDIYEKKSSSCSPPTATPGNSNHEQGQAVDVANCGRGTAKFKWLVANAGKYGWKNLPSESWHWSTNGK